MKSSGELTRPTHFVSCVKLNLNTTNLRNRLTLYHPELEEKQRPVADASRRTIKQAVAQLQPNSESEADYQIHCKFYCIGFKTVFSCGERGFSDDGDHSRAKIQKATSALLHN